MIQGFAPAAGVFAAMILRTDRRIARQLRDQRATSAESAVMYGPSNRFVRWRLERLVERGAVRRVSPERVYLDETGWSAFRVWRRRRVLRVLAVVAVGLLALYLSYGCRETTPEDAVQAREGLAERNALQDSLASVIDAQVPSAVAGDTGWKYAQRVTADLDGDGKDETAVLISDVMLDARGQPLWEDGHRWQLYVQEESGEVTRLYARFVPNGKITVELGVPASGSRIFIVLLEQSPDFIRVYEYEYQGPTRADMRKRVDRALDPVNKFQGSPRP